MPEISDAELVEEFERIINEAVVINRSEMLKREVGRVAILNRDRLLALLRDGLRWNFPDRLANANDYFPLKESPQ